MNDISKLLCGHENSEGIAKIALEQLSKSVEEFSKKAHSFLANKISDEALMFGPFCARVLLENGCAALVGRLDSFRLLYLSEFQAQIEYEHGRRAKSAFSWTTDVMPEEKPTQALWSVDYETAKISRALFSKHLEHVYWKPAVNKMLDYLSTQAADPALTDVLATDPDTFIGEMRGRAAQLYSTLSKGVHWEFFTSALVFDELTVKNTLRDTFLLIAHLGLVSHFIPTAYASVTASEAVKHYSALRKTIP